MQTAFLVACMKMVEPDFFTASPVECARRLIGCEFWWMGRAGRIVETEAYLAEGDEACHTWNRPSARLFVASHAAGDAYVYLNYGVHWLFNVLVKGEEGSGFVLLRALESTKSEIWPEPRAGAGPGKLTKILGIGGAAHGAAFLREPSCGIVLAEKIPVTSGPRIGISKAVDHPWRFGDPSSKCLSRKF